MSAPPESDVSAYLAAEMLSASGLGPYSRPELTKILLDKQVSFSFWTQSYLRGFQGIASVNDLETLYQMIYLSFTQPRLDPDAVKALLDQRRSALAFQENDPNAYFSREISRTVSGNKRLHPLELEGLEKANIEDALAFIKTCLNPADYTFVITGSLEPEIHRTMAATYIASIPGSKTFNEWADIDPERPRDTEREIRKGKEERSAVYMGWFRPESYSEEKSIAVSGLSEYLEILLNDEIREKLGGVYSISSGVSLSPIPRGELSGGAFFICDPKRAEELSTAVKEEFLKIKSGNIDMDAFGKAAEALIKEQEESVQRNLYIAQSYANSSVIYRSPLSRLDRRPGLYRALKPEDIQKTLADLLEGNLVKMILYPEH
jgi:zinc protease